MKFTLKNTMEYKIIKNGLFINARGGHYKSVLRGYGLKVKSTVFGLFFVGSGN